MVCIKVEVRTILQNKSSGVNGGCCGWKKRRRRRGLEKLTRYIVEEISEL